MGSCYANVMRLAYTTSDQPGRMNAALRALAEALAAAQLRSVGAVQANLATGPDDADEMQLTLLPDGPCLSISQALGPGSTGCRLDPAALEQAVAIAGSRLAAGADVLIVNKFGSHEAEGRGFRELIGTALANDVPVIVGVAPAKLAAFQDFAGGLAEELPCDAAVLAAWVGMTHAA